METTIQTTECRKQSVPLSMVAPAKENPRRDFGDIDGLAARIRVTGGQPVNPIVVACDGDRYRIVDGERRYRALLAIHGDEGRTDALVYDDISAAHAAVAMLATDDKLQLSPAEQALGFQTMLALGVDEREQSAVLRRSVADVRRAAKVAAEAPEQATLDQMIAAAGFEGEDRAAVLAAKPAAYAGVVAKISKRHERERKMAPLREALGELGIPVVGERPDGYAAGRYVSTADGIRDYVAENAGVDLVATEYAWGAGCFLHARVTEREETPEERAARELDERRTAAFDALTDELFDHALHNDGRTALLAAVGRTRGMWDRYHSDMLADAVKTRYESNALARLATQCPASTYEALRALEGTAYGFGWHDYVCEFLPPAIEDGYVPSSEDLWLMGLAESEREAREAEARKAEGGDAE